MKTKALLITILSIVAGGSSNGELPSASPPPDALVIVIDTSWSCDRYMGDFLTLSRQAALTLRPRDYLEIIAAQPGSPRIKLAQTVKTGSAEEIKSIDAALATVRAQFLSTASRASALEVAFERLNNICSKKGITIASAILFTDCQMDNEEAKRLLTLADRFKEKGWSLYLTCDRKTANRDILLGVNKGKLACSIIAETNPAIWLEKKAEGLTAKTKDEKALEPKPPEQPSVPPPGESRQDHITGQPQTPLTPGYRITTQIDSTVSFPPTQLPGSEVGGPPQGPALEANEPPGPVAEQPAVEQPPERVEVPQRSFWARLKGAFYSYWWLIPTAAVLTGLALLISQSIGQAHKWDTRVKGHLAASASSDPGMLVMRCGDQYYQLGPLDRFRSAHIGPGSKNTIRTPDITTGDRLLKLYRHRQDVMVKNLGAASIIANGIEVKPGRKHRLVVPSVIQVNEKTKLNLELVRHNTSPAQIGRSSDHEREAEPQPVG